MKKQKSSKPVSQFNISASALSAFDTCQARYKYSREWQLRGEYEPGYFALGSEVHSVMAGDKLASAASEQASKMANVLQTAEYGLGLHILHRELTQVFRITPDVMLTRVIDGLGYDRSGYPIIVDYKTSSKPWKVYHGIAPKALSWQTTLYLLPPTDNVLSDIDWDDNWPSQIMYLVVAYNLSVQSFIVHSDKAQNKATLYKRIGEIQAAERGNFFTREYGINCDYCSFRDICLDAPDWKLKYKERGG